MEGKKRDEEHRGREKGGEGTGVGGEVNQIGMT
jgi:hypothetical protein